MNANDLIAQVKECRSEQWQNSDISAGGERLLEIVAAHYEDCEECRQNFDDQEYEETSLIDLWHRFMAVNEAPEEWICEEGLQALFDHPLYVYLVTIENSDPPQWSIETSEMGARFGLEKRFPGAEFGDFELCEELEAVEDEYVMMVTVGGETVARVYTQGA